MYRKDSTGWIKHVDFIILDLICLQVAFVLAYNMRRYISRQIYEMKNIDSRLKEIRKELKLFLDKYSSKKSEGD